MLYHVISIGADAPKIDGIKVPCLPITINTPFESAVCSEPLSEQRARELSYALICQNPQMFHFVISVNSLRQLLERAALSQPAPAGNPESPSTSRS